MYTISKNRSELCIYCDNPKREGEYCTLHYISIIRARKVEMVEISKRRANSKRKRDIVKRWLNSLKVG